MAGLSFAERSVRPPGSPLKTCPHTPNCVSSQAGDPEHAIAPFLYSGGRAEAYARIKDIVGGMKRTKIVAEKEDYLHAEFKSLIFRFIDDVEFYFPEDQNIIHVRSASRVGHSDMGVNRKRVEEIRRIFDR
ncbi:MAG: DUF1499 domain-containing protein [Deltaproteobacteria bacterium HGW-Deltaproteobacteria-12]|nr:MAG: DUF1499 domain-containing protein [Deltaproteobacteria bacterium HGW-Deltaproteobacteria-12]